MKISNLERAATIQRELPALKDAKTLLSSEASYILACQGGHQIELPRCIIPHLLRAIHYEINNLEKEVASL